MDFLFYVLFIVFTIVDLIDLIKQKNKSNIIIFIGLTIIALILSISFYKSEYKESLSDILFKYINIQK